MEQCFSVVFGGFASDQLASRINHAKPKVDILIIQSNACNISFLGRCYGKLQH